MKSSNFKKNIHFLFEDMSIKYAINKLSLLKERYCIVIDRKHFFRGTITDGDVRRKILNVQKPFSALLGDDLALHINKKPKKVHINSNLDKAFKIMKKNSIWDLPVIDKNNKLQGMLHLHPVVKFFLNK